MKNFLTVVKYTFLEVYRSKVMMSIVFMAIGLLLITFVASEFAYGAPSKVALDFGMGIMTLSNLGMAIFIGSNLLSKEIEQKTLHMILSRPISRASFLLGKIGGLSSVLLINTILLSALSIFIFIKLGGGFNGLMIWVSFFSFVESFMILLFAILFSLLTNTSMSVIYTIIVFIIGHSINETSKLFFAKTTPFFRVMLDLGSFLIPSFYKLNLKDFLIYRQSIAIDYLMDIQIYSFFYVLALLTLIVYIFKNKNLD